MIKEIYGKKIGMTQIFSEEGEQIPITLLQIDPVCILEKIEYKNKSMARIGCFKIEGKKVDKVKKPLKGYFDKIDVSPYKLIREVEIEEGSDFSFLTKKIQAPQKVTEKDKSDNEPEKTEQVAQDKETVDKDKNPEAQDESQVIPEKEGSEKQDKNKKPNLDLRYIGIEIFSEGDVVKAQAVTKGKGCICPDIWGTLSAVLKI